MSQTRRIAYVFDRSITPNTSIAVDDPLLEDSTNESLINDEETICLQDLLNSPEFLEEQRVILLEFEASRLCIDNERRTPPRRQGLDSRSRRSSIGIKLTCPICLESLGSVRSSYVKMVTECGHIFCQDCIENVCKNATKVATKKIEGAAAALCPVCREAVGELRKVYF